MIKKFLTLAVIASLVVACNSNKQQSQDSSDVKVEAEAQTTVPYEAAKNYFVKNTVANEAATLKITTQEDFDKYFGAAASMGPDGKPTPIDFSKQYVIAVVGLNTDKPVTAEPVSLTKDGDKLVFSYKWEEGADAQTFTARHSILVLVDNQYQGEVVFNKQ